MLENILWACAFVLVCIGLYRFALPAFRRFDAANVARAARQEADKFDPDAHFRHALEVANEQVEAVSEIQTGGGGVQYLFEAQLFTDRGQAEEARAIRVGVIARRFYAELPQALAGGAPRSAMSARERAARRWRGRG